MIKQDYLFIAVKHDSNNFVKHVAIVRTGPTGSVKNTFSTDKDFPEGFLLKDMTRLMQQRVITPYDSKFIVVGHNIQPIRKTMGDYFVGRAWIDTQQLMWPFVFAELITSRLISDLAKFLDVPMHGDTAEAECACLVRMYFKLVRKFRTAIIGENAMTDLGGESLEVLRTMIGF